MSKLLTNKELLLTDKQRKWFLGTEGCCEDCWKDLECYYVNIVDKAVAGLERTDSKFARSSTVSKMLSNSTVYYRKIAHERKSHLIQQTSLLSYCKKLPLAPPWHCAGRRYREDLDLGARLWPPMGNLQQLQFKPFEPEAGWSWCTGQTHRSLWKVAQP